MFLYTEPSPLNKFPPNFLYDVEAAGNRLVSKAAQLVQNKTTKITETAGDRLVSKLITCTMNIFTNSVITGHLWKTQDFI